MIDGDGPQAEGQRDAAAKTKRDADLHDAYLRVFGPPGERTPLGELILKDLEQFTIFHSETIGMDQTGRVDPYKTIYRDGKQAVVKRIHMRINWSPPDADRR